MARLYNKFEFIGNIYIPKEEKFHKIQEFDGGWCKHTINFAVQESKTNSAFVELEGGYSNVKANKVVTFGKGTENVQGSKLEIPWTDRLDPSTIDMVADFKKIVVDFTTDNEVKEKVNKLRYEIRTIEYKDEQTSEDKDKLKKLKSELKEVGSSRHEFIHSYDAINFLANKLPDYKDNKFRITGNVTYSSWEGRVYRKFEPELIEIVDNETKSQLRATFDIYFTKDSVDEKDFKNDKKVYINGYVLSYDSQVKKDRFFPSQFIINAAKIDFDNEMHVKRFNYLKNKFTVKGKGVFHLQWVVNIFRGADRVEFTEKDLTPSQRESIEFGYNKLEDFAPKGGLLGESVFENRLVKPNLTKINDANNFVDGAVESSYSVEDLDFVPVKTETKKEPVKQEVKSEEKKLDVELDDLFS